MNVAVDVVAILAGVLICGFIGWAVWTFGPRKDDK